MLDQLNQHIADRRQWQEERQRLEAEVEELKAERGAFGKVHASLNHAAADLVEQVNRLEAEVARLTRENTILRDIVTDCVKTLTSEAARIMGVSSGELPY